MSTKIKTQKQLYSYIDKRADVFKLIKDKDYVEKMLKSFKDDNLPNPFDVVREFIKDKGLKLYGGQALHEHLTKKNKPIYNEYEFPDYDVFSPDAWNHAQELCDILYKLGFFFVEAKASIVNDDKHQTYKVSVDLIYVLDLTQVGCPAKNLKNGDCDNCGLSLDNKCFSLFNNIPALDILTNDKKEYTETYNYNKKKGYHADKMFVSSPNWLKISMYLELTQPLQDPSRLEKVYKRLSLFESEFSYDKCVKDITAYNSEKKLSKNKQLQNLPSEKVLNKPIIKQLYKFTDKYITDKKLPHYGLTAYNFYITGHKLELQPVVNYEVYTDSEPHHSYEAFLEQVKQEFGKTGITFKLVPRIMYWKDVDSDNYDIYFKPKRGGFHHLITFTKTYECLPYIEDKKTRYASFDRIKYIFYKGAVLSNIAYISEPLMKDYACFLKNLVEIEAKLKKKEDSQIISGKYQPFVETCMGGDINKLLGNLYANFGKSLRLSKKTKMYLDTPEEGFITKVYPKEKDMIMTSYRPAEKKTKYYKKLIKFVEQPTVRKSNKKREVKKMFQLKSRRKLINKIRVDKTSEETGFRIPNPFKLFMKRDATAAATNSYINNSSSNNERKKKLQKRIDIDISNSL